LISFDLPLTVSHGQQNVHSVIRNRWVRTTGANRLVFAGNDNLRGRRPNADVDVCFNDNIAVIAVGIKRVTTARFLD
jgi:hypothetical protein